MKRNTAHESLERIEAALAKMKKMLDELLAATRRTAPVKQAYSVAEVAAILEKSNFTVREWCRLQRIKATKRACGRGTEMEWEISHKELDRIQNHGLLPIPKHY
jgi:hypothetical protein